MGCNCGDNEYNITVNNNGNCEPTTPIYNITLANVGVNGYSPIVRFINETVESFNIAVDNVTGTETSPAVPKLSYVADQIDNVNNTIAGLGSTYLTRSGNNATLPFSIGNLTLYSDSTTISGSINASGYIATGEIRPRNSSGITIGYSNYNAPINLVTGNKVNYNGSEIATLSDIPTLTDRLKTDGSNADNDFTVNGVELAGNYVYMNSVSYGGVSVVQSNSDIYAKLEVDSSRAYLKLPALNINSGTSGNIACNTTRDIVVNGSNTSHKMYYHGTSADDEIATLGDITGTSYVAGDNITINGDTISATDTTYSNFVGATTLVGGSAGLVPAPTTNDAGKYLRANGTWSKVSGSSIDNPINLITDSNDMFWMGIATNTTPHQIYGGCQNSNGVQYLKYIYDSSNPIALTDDPLGHGTSKIELNYNTNTMGLDSSNKLTVKEMTGCDSVTGGSSGLVPAPSAGDEDKFLKADGTWDTVGGGGSSYTAGTGIDITNDTISVDSTILTTNTAQTITGDKTFSADIHLDGGDIKLDSTTSYIQGKDSSNNYRTIIGRSVGSSTIAIGNSGDTLTLKGNGLHPKYNGTDMALLTDIPTVPTNISAFNNDSGYITGINSSDVTTALGYTPYNSSNPNGYITSSALSDYVTATALSTTLADYVLSSSLATVATTGAYSDLTGTPTIPTVNNSTITFTQGGVTKGTITLNQSGNATIALDAGGGGATIDDTTPSTTTVYSSQKTQDLIDALTARIAALEANINGGNA